MRALLDTNILIHREASKVVKKDIGVLFNWLDKLGYEKCIHPFSLDEIRKHQDSQVVQTIEAKLKSYSVLKTIAPESTPIVAIRTQDVSENDSIDTSLVKEVFANRVDLFISEDRGIHKKAATLGISDRVFKIDDFLEKVISENPDLADYRVLAVKKDHFGNVTVSDPFFDSFKEDYRGFEGWFNRKSDEIAYVCRGDKGEMMAFLYVKVEGPGENYRDIKPALQPKRRLKIGTFKVILNGFKLGERFLKIVFDNAFLFDVDEIYVTIFKKRPDQERLIYLLEDWGFVHHGVKETENGDELVYIRSFRLASGSPAPRKMYPYISRRSKKYVVPIKPEFHTELLPDSILRNESPEDYIENRPNRNAIHKTYISRSIFRDLKPGDVIIFYRTKGNSPAFYTSVTTTLGIVEEVKDGITSLEDFKRLCGKRTVFTDVELDAEWNRNPRYHPFIVNFLYAYSFPKKLNLKDLMRLGILREAPRGFERISDEAFNTLLEESHAEKRIIID